MQPDNNAPACPTPQPKLAAPLCAVGLPLAGLLALDASAQLNWQQRTPTTRPSPRFVHQMVYQEHRATCLLFGGYRARDAAGNLAQASDETWEWDGAAGTWTQRATTGPRPPARGAFSMAYDPRQQLTVAFGGWTGSAWLGDTWEWDGTAWTQQRPATAPSPRDSANFAFDGQTGKLLLFGGVDTTGFEVSDTWEYDTVGKVWTQRSPSQVPAPRQHSGMVWDELRRRVFLFAGSPTRDAWEWDHTLNTWILLSTPVGPSPIAPSMIYHAARHRAMAYDQFPAQRTWEWDRATNTWTNVTVTPAPPARDVGGFAYDRARQVGVLFGGEGANLGQLLDDTWEVSSQNPAAYVRFGSGCGGATNAPTLSSLDNVLPWLGDTVPQRVRVPSGSVTAAAGIVGLSRTTWLGASLPFDLSGVGLTGCSLLVSADLNAPLSIAGGEAQFDLTVPVMNSLLGRSVFAQAFVAAPGVNPAGLTTSNGAELRFGRR